jgi:hypothetical protein
MNGPAIEQTAKEIVDVVFDLDKRSDWPRFILSSRDLCQVPITATSNSDVVPLGSRLDEIEKTVGKLVKSLDDMKNNPVKNTFADIAGGGNVSGQGGGGWPSVGGQGRGGGGGAAGGQNRGGGGRGGAPYGEARSRLDSLSGGNILGNVLPH